MDLIGYVEVYCDEWVDKGHCNTDCQIAPYGLYLVVQLVEVGSAVLVHMVCHYWKFSVLKHTQVAGLQVDSSRGIVT